MAREPKTLADSIQDVDQHNRALFNEMTEENKKLQKTIDAMTRIAKTRKTLRAKLTLQNRRLKHQTRKQNERIDKLETANTRLSTENSLNADDLQTIKRRLDDNSCAYCGTPTPAPAPATSSTDTGTQTTSNKHFMG